MENFSIEDIAGNLKLSEQGIWQNSSQKPISYPESGNRDCFAVEDNSFWFSHRNKCIIELLKQFPPLQNTLFDVGGGNGSVSAAIMQAGFNPVLIEPGVEGARNAKTRAVRTIICSTLEDAQFKAASIPSVGLFDVIEHIENDLEFLESLQRLLQKQGRIYLTVPAYSCLWSHEDVYAGHYRRFTKRALQKIVSAAGFEILFATYFFQPLPLPVLLMRSLPYRLGVAPKPAASVARDHGSENSLASRLLGFMLNHEIIKIQNRVPMLFGGSILLAAQKK